MARMLMVSWRIHSALRLIDSRKIWRANKFLDYRFLEVVFALFLVGSHLQDRSCIITNSFSINYIREECLLMVCWRNHCEP